MKRRKKSILSRACAGRKQKSARTPSEPHLKSAKLSPFTGPSIFRSLPTIGAVLAPIRDEDGTVMGLIDISCLTDRRHPFMLGMGATAAHAIEREISAHTKKNEAELISHCLEKIDSDQPFIVCNEKDKIVAASRPVRERFSDWRRMDVNDLYERGFAGGTSRQFSPPKTGGPSVSRLHWLKCPAIKQLHHSYPVSSIRVKQEQAGRFSRRFTT